MEEDNAPWNSVVSRRVIMTIKRLMMTPPQAISVLSFQLAHTNCQHLSSVGSPLQPSRYMNGEQRTFLTRYQQRLAREAELDTPSHNGAVLSWINNESIMLSLHSPLFQTNGYTPDQNISVWAPVSRISSKPLYFPTQRSNSYFS